MSSQFKSLARYFLYLGVTGFGGPLVLVQMMRQHFVSDKKQMSETEFDQTFALVKAMPGPVAFQMATFIGQKLLGFRGGIIAAICLLLPAFIMMVLTGYFYETLVQYKHVNEMLLGLLYAATAVILLSLKNLVKPYKNKILFWAFILINVFLAWFHILPEPVLIILFGLLSILFNQIPQKPVLMSVPFLFFDFDKIIQLFKTFLYAGAFVFGTGFALIPVLKTELVDVHQLISLQQFNDGVIFGQMTPGPITITATFLGYQVSGFWGALTATIAVFLLPFIHMVTWFPRVMNWMSQQKWISVFVLGATAAVIAAILTTLIKMNTESYQKINFWIIFLVSSFALHLKPKASILVIFTVAGIANIILASLL